MSLDKSLRSRGALARHRNVLSRAERLEVLKEGERWTEDRAVFGLPKVAHRKVTTKKPKTVAAAGAEAAPGAEGAAAPAAAPAAKAAAPKAAAPAKGAGKGKA